MVSNKLTIQEVERRHPDMVKGQVWKGAIFKYKFYCTKHGEYLQTYSNHNSGHRCLRCARSRASKNRFKAAEGLSNTPEYRTVHRHFNAIFNPKGAGYRHYKNIPFFDGWNPHKGGSLLEAVKWIIKNLGNNPKGSSMHIVEHEEGFIPGNLEWTYPKKQNAQQMFKIIADLKHEIKKLKLKIKQLITAKNKV